MLPPIGGSLVPPNVGVGGRGPEGDGVTRGVAVAGPPVIAVVGVPPPVVGEAVAAAPPHAASSTPTARNVTTLDRFMRSPPGDGASALPSPNLEPMLQQAQSRKLSRASSVAQAQSRKLRSTRPEPSWRSR